MSERREKFFNVISKYAPEVLKFIAIAPFHPMQDWHTSRTSERVKSLLMSSACVTASLLAAVDVGIATGEPVKGVVAGVGSWAFWGLGASTFFGSHHYQPTPASSQ